MESKFVPSLRGLLVCLFALAVIATAAVAAPVSIQDKKQDEKKEQGPQVSGDERNAIEKVIKAANAEAKMKAASDYAKKFPKGVKRQEVAGTIANEIYRIQDNNQKIKFAQEFSNIFNQPGEADLVRPSLIEAYFTANKFDEALAESIKYLEKNPDDVTIHVQITWAGATLVQKQVANPKLLEAALQSGAKGVELMEADKKPSWMDDKRWAEYRNSWLWRLYQARGIILQNNGDRAGAKESLEKAAGIESYDPSLLIQLVNLTQEEYQALAQQYQKEQKPELMNKAVEKMDELIDWSARAVAATDGNAQLQSLNQQLLDNLKQFYSFRNNGKTDGLQGLIEKYKKKG